MSIATTLDNAAELINEKGLFKGDEPWGIGDDGSLCPIAAIFQAEGVYVEQCEAVEVLRAHLRDSRSNSNIVEWAGDPQTTAEDVVATLRHLANENR